jgi:hypothetical protein
MRIIGTDKKALVASQSLEAHPNVGLNVLDQVPQMDVSVRVWERSGHQEFSIGHLSA